MARIVSNAHCFIGREYTYWSHKAAGFQPIRPEKGRIGRRLDLGREKGDGNAVQNGGIYNPQPDRMNAGYYFRFVALRIHNNPQSGASYFTGGPWWINRDTLAEIESYAETAEISLARAAQRLLAIPPEWGDCAYLGCAELTCKLKAFVGKGKPASGGDSPFMKDRKGTLLVPPAHIEIKQFFVPGAPELLQAAFRPIFTQGVLQRGVQVQSVAGKATHARRRR